MSDQRFEASISTQVANGSNRFSLKLLLLPCGMISRAKKTFSPFGFPIVWPTCVKVPDGSTCQQVLGVAGSLSKRVGLQAFASSAQASQKRSSRSSLVARRWAVFFHNPKGFSRKHGEGFFRWVHLSCSHESHYKVSLQGIIIMKVNARSHSKESLQGVIARSYCKESVLGVIARSHCKESLQGVIARSHCKELLQGVSARSHCKESLQGVIARSHCKESLQGVIARSHCKKSLQGVIARSHESHCELRMEPSASCKCKESSASCKRKESGASCKCMESSASCKCKESSASCKCKESSAIDLRGVKISS